MKIFSCIVYWLTHEIEFVFPAQDSQQFLNELKERLIQTNKSPDFKFGKIEEY